MVIDPIYVSYVNYLKTIVDLNEIPSFKENSAYIPMLEHVPPYQGAEYLNLIQSKAPFSLQDIEEYCKLNDMYGGGYKHPYWITTSPSNFRYIYHAHLILTHFSSTNVGNNEHYRLIDIVEVGGGYGGLCLAINFFKKFYPIQIRSYSIVDLEVVSKFQKKYLGEHLDELEFQVNFYNAEEYGENIDVSNAYLISNYCFSEISEFNRNQYELKLFPKISHGFLAWNAIPTYDFGFKFTEEPEVPMTGNEYNKYVKF